MRQLIELRAAIFNLTIMLYGIIDHVWYTEDYNLYYIKTLTLWDWVLPGVKL